MLILVLLLLFLSPAYVIKFSVGQVNLNVLFIICLSCFLGFLCWLTLKHKWSNYLTYLKRLEPKLLIGIFGFCLAGVIALFYPRVSVEKFGEFIVLFVCPILSFFIVGFLGQTLPALKPRLLMSLYIYLGFMGLLAILQYFTLWSLPTAYWGNSIEPKRAVGLFLHPNFYSLFSAPLLAFLLGDLGFKLENIKQNGFWIMLWVLGVIGLGLSLSRSGWLGLGVAGLVYLFLVASKQVKQQAKIIILILAFIVLLTPNLRWRIILPFYGEKSAVSRISLWQAGLNAIKTSPLLGNSLNGFQDNWTKFNPNPTLDSHKYPHNLLLTLWTELGVLGLLSFSLIIFYIWKKTIKNSQDPMALGIVLFILTLLTQGLIDNPYFKNDLALIFWLIISLAV
jgi:O-antigen ligase